MKAIFKYSRFHVQEEDRFDLLHDAMLIAHHSVEHNESYPIEIVVDGTVYSRDDMEKYWAEHDFDKKSL
ncbi:MAG: hypothetical protein JWM44_1336 [Bacilli bacterium]|nr:hypothetical protein [Bacilli bacterium]